MKHILIVQGHPDSSESHYCHALGNAYRDGAREAGHQAHMIDIGTIDIPILRSQKEWQSSDLPDFVRDAHSQIKWADHIVFIYPLWLGSMPALLKAWLEQVLRESFAFEVSRDSGNWKAHLKGKSARIIVTMGMPAFFYRWFFLAHSLKSFERNILKFSGIKPIRESLIGTIDAQDPADRLKWLDKMKEFGRIAS